RFSRDWSSDVCSSDLAERAEAVVAEIKAAGARGLAIPAEATDAAALTQAVELTVSTLGRLDILVNNAGIAPYGPLEDVTLADVDRTLAIHTRASFVLAQAAARHLTEGD